MARDVGITFKSDSFKTFNEQLNTFVKISNKVDDGLGKISTSFGRTENSTIKFNKTFSNMLNDFIKLDKKLSGLNFGSSGRFNFQKNGLFQTLEKFSKLKVSNAEKLFKFSDAILRLSDVVSVLQTTTVDNKKVEDFGNSINKVFSIFSGTNTSAGALQKYGNALKNILSIRPGNLSGAFSKNKGTVGLISMLQKFSSIDISKFKVISNSITDFVKTLSALSTLETGDIDIKSIKTAFTGLMEIFTGKNKSLIGGLKSFAKLEFRDGVSKLFGSKGIIGQISKIKPGSIDGFIKFSTSLVSFAKTFNILKDIKVDKEQIKNIGEAFTSLTKAFIGKSSKMGSLSLGLFGDKGIIGQISKIKNIDKLATFANALFRFAKTLGKIGEISLGDKGASDFVRQAKEISKGFKSIAKDTRGLDTKGLDSISKAASRMGRALNTGLGSTVTEGFPDTLSKAAKKGIEATKRTFEIRSPSKVFARIGVSLAKGLAQGFKLGLKAIKSAFNLITGIAKKSFGAIKSVGSKAINGLLSPINFLKRHFVITFSDIQRSVQSLFRGIIGNTIEFESAFTGVLKTLDTSEIFAAGGQDAVDVFTAKLESDLLALTTDTDSLVSGLEDGFVRLSGIAELAGQLGVESTGIAQFADVIGQLSLATDLTDEAASFFLAKFTNITGTQNFEQLGSAVVTLGNNLAVTESQIAETAQRIVASGTAAGLSEPQILGWAAAMRASGISSEAGSSAFIRFTSEIAKSVASGEQEIFANQLGLTNDEFTKMFENDPNEIFTQLIGTLGELDRTEVLLFEEAAGLDGIRLDQFVQSLALSEENSGTLTEAMRLANEGMVEFGDSTETYNALQAESARRMGDTASKLNRMKNAFKSLSNTFGKFIKPVFDVIVDRITTIVLGIDKFLQGFTRLKEVGNTFGLTGDDSNVSLLEEENEALGIQAELYNTLGIAVQASGTGIEVYQFKVGDTLSALAEEYGTTVDAILELNDATLQDFADGMSEVKLPIDELLADTLTLPGDEKFIVYEFEVGDTLSALALEYDTTVDAILELNDATLEDFANGLSEVKIPLQEIADLDALGGLSDDIDGTNKAVKGFLETVAEENNLSTMKDDLKGVKEGFSKITSGNFKVGLDEIKNSTVALKDSVKGLFKSFLGSGEDGGIPDDIFVTNGLTPEGMMPEFDADNASFAALLIETISQIFDIDLTPIYEFVKDNITNIIVLGFGLFVGSPISLGITTSKLLLDIFDFNFGDSESEVNDSSIVGKLKNLAETIIDIWKEAFSGITDIFSGENGVELTGIDAIDESNIGIEENTSFGDKIIESLKLIFKASGRIFGEVTKVIGEFLIDIFIFSIENLSSLTSVFGELATSIAIGFSDAFSEFSSDDESGEAANSMVESFGESFGQATSALGAVFVEILGLALKNLPGLIEMLAEFSLSFLKGLANSLKNSEGKIDIINALEVLLGSVFVTLTAVGIIGGGGIIASMAGALTTMISGAIALINPATIALILGAAVILWLADEEFRNGVNKGIQEVFASALGFESFGEWIDVSSDRLVGAIGGFLNAVISWFQIRINDIMILFLEITTGLKLGGGPELEAAKERREMLKLVSSLRDDMMSVGDEDTLNNFLNAGGDLGDIAGSSLEVGLEFGLNGDRLAEAVTQSMLELKEKISTEDLGAVEVFEELLSSGFSDENITTVLEELGLAEEMKAYFEEQLSNVSLGTLEAGEVLVEFAEYDIDNESVVILAENLGVDLEDDLAALLGEDTVEVIIGGVQFVGAEVGTGAITEEELVSLLIDSLGLEEVDNELLNELVHQELINQGFLQDIPIAADFGSTIGQNIVDGLEQPLVDEINGDGTLNETIPEFTTVYEDMMRDNFESNSPSKMTERIGSDLILGLSNGMKNAIVFLKSPIDMIVDELKRVSVEVTRIVTGLWDLATNIRILQGMGLNLEDIIPLVTPGGGKKFGGPVIAGSVYEILEGNLPFEIFETNNQTFFLPNENGNIISPLSQPGILTGTAAAANGVGGGTTISNGGDVNITVPINFETVPTDVSSAQLTNISDAISDGVTTRLNDSLRANTLTDRLTQKGRV